MVWSQVVTVIVIFVITHNTGMFPGLGGWWLHEGGLNLGLGVASKIKHLNSSGMSFLVLLGEYVVMVNLFECWHIPEGILHID